MIQNSARSQRAFKVIISGAKYTIKAESIEGKRELMELFRRQKTIAMQRNQISSRCNGFGRSSSED